METTPHVYALPDGWVWPDAETLLYFDDELQRELHSLHPLYRVRVMAFAAHDTTDDVLFRHCDEPNRFTVVHLTWAGRTEIPGYPSVECDGSFATFLECYGTAHGEQRALDQDLPRM